MNRYVFIILCSVVITTSAFFTASAQQTAVYQEPGASYNLGVDLYQKEKYGAASEQFEKVIRFREEAGSLLYINARYYEAVCALELEHGDAEYKLQNFIKKYPENSNTRLAYYQLGKHQFSNGDFRKALESFSEVDQFGLSRREKAELFFKKGYAYFQTKEYQRAKSEFRKLLDRETSYQSSAIFYYAQIAYLEEDYPTALEYFEKLKKDIRYRKTIPLYLVHIYHQQGVYDKVIAEGVPMYESVSSRDKGTLAHLIGNAYYQAGDYQKALPYLEFYSRTNRRSMDRSDYYQLAYALFRNKRYNEAARFFQDVAAEKDSLAQNAYYHLAYCYIKEDQKQFASNAFASAYELDYDREITEDALFNYAKLSMEISKDPYNTSIQNLEKYLEDFPDSPRRTEAHKYLASLYLSTNNYERALQSIEKIQYKNPEMSSAYQKILFYRGVELFNQHNFQGAINHFKQAEANAENKKMAAEANFWTGEAFYRLKNHWGAMKYYKLFLQSGYAKSSEFYDAALYNLGYTYFKREDYKNAIAYFDKYLQVSGDKGSKMTNDALLRIADSYIIHKRYEQAIRYYDKALEINKIDGDYALHQKARAQGALGKFDDKIYTLNALVNQYSNSTLADDALYDIATTYLLINNNRKALQYFNRLCNTYPKSSMAKKGMLKTGLIYYNENKNQEAIRTLKEVISKYPGTSESREALSSLQNIYVNLNQVDKYYAFANDLSFADISASEQDSVTYMAAENSYMDNHCDEAIEAFSSYLEKFPQGFFAPNANYYMAECLMRQDKREEALEAYENVIRLPRTRFTENAMLNAGTLQLEQNNHEKALPHFTALEEIAENKSSLLKGYAGQMKCNYQLANYRETIEAAEKLLRTETVSNELINEAHFLMAHSYLKTGDATLAEREFSITEKLTDSELGAESNYYLAFLAYKKDKYKEAEEIIFRLAEHYAAYDKWVAKGFILLADVYVKLDNVFQAKQTLQSIIDNYKGDELKEVARKKLEEISTTDTQETGSETPEKKSNLY